MAYIRTYSITLTCTLSFQFPKCSMNMGHCLSTIQKVFNKKKTKNKKRYREKQSVAMFLNFNYFYFLTELPVPLQYRFRLIFTIFQHNNI